MYDMHYDLLTILYYNLKNKNPLADVEKLIEDCYKIYHNNVLGGIINLYFMSSKEMKDELGLEERELDVIPMFRKSVQFLERFREAGIISWDIDFLFGIEGCDFLNGPDDLFELYNLGARAIIPVWNEPNKFGSGNRGDYGLTALGKELINKAIDLGMIIDVSHANEKTFSDILDIVESRRVENKDITVMASHCNVRKLCNRDRNLTDEQLIRLRNAGGYIGLFTNGNFLSSNNKNLSYEERQKEYVKHLRYLIDNLHYPSDKILVSTDDMNFNPDTSYHHLEAFPIEHISKQLYEVISKEFDFKLAEDILYNNPKGVIDKYLPKSRFRTK